MGFPYGIENGPNLITISATTSATNADCSGKSRILIDLTLNADTILTLNNLIAGAEGTILLRQNTFVLDRTFALTNSDDPAYFHKKTTVISFCFDGTRIYTQSSAKISQKSFGSNLNNISTNLTLYLAENEIGEFLNVALWGTTSVANNTANYWQLAINDISNSQPNILLDTKFFATANTRTVLNGMAPTGGRRVTNNQFYRCVLTRVGSPGNLSIHSLNIVDFVS